MTAAVQSMESTMAEKQGTKVDVAALLANLTDEQKAAIAAQAAAKGPKPFKAPTVELGSTRVTMTARRPKPGKSRGWIARLKIDLPDPGTGEVVRHQCNIDCYVTGPDGKVSE